MAQRIDVPSWGELDTIVVKGNVEDIGKGALELYFTNKKKCGGGDITNILIQPNQTLITFTDASVAARVVETTVHRILGKEVTVELVACRKSAAAVPVNAPHNAILLNNMSDTISDGVLILYIDNLTGLDCDKGDYIITHSSGTQVVVSFSRIPPDGIDEVVSMINAKPLKNATLNATTCLTGGTKTYSSSVFTNDVLICNLPAEKCHTRKLAKHFSSKKKSGINSYKGIKILRNNMALLCLENDKAVDAVFSQKQDALSKTISLVRCVELLFDQELNIQPSAIEPNITVYPNIQPSANDPFFIQLDQQLIPCIDLYQQKLDAELKVFHAAMQLDKEQCQLQIIPCPGNESIKDWKLCCKRAVDAFMESLKVESLKFSADKVKFMRPVISMTIQTEKAALHIEYLEDSHTVIIAGEKVEVDRVEVKLNEIYSTIIVETIPVVQEKFLVLMAAKLKYGLTDAEINVSVNDNDSSITIMGLKEKCEDFKSYLDKQREQVEYVPVLLDDLFVQFLCTKTGRILLKYYLQEHRSEVVAYFDQGDRLFILGTTDSQTAITETIKSIQERMHCFRLVCPPSFTTFLQSTEWDSLCTKFESKQIVQIKTASHYIEVIGDVKLGKPVMKQIETLIDDKCQPMRYFELCSAQWKVIQMYLGKKWHNLKCKLQNEKRVQAVLPNPDDINPIIIVEGNMSALEPLVQDFEKLLAVIVCSKPIRLSQHSLLKYFRKDKGQAAIEEIEAKEQSCIQLSTEYNNDVMLTESSASESDATETNLVEQADLNNGDSQANWLVASRQTVLSLQVYAIDTETVKKTEACLRQLVASRTFTDRIVDRVVSQLTPKLRSRIEQKAKDRNVNIAIEQGKLQHYIQMEGGLNDVINVKHEIHSVLCERGLTESMQNEIQNTESKVKWHWQNKSGSFEGYDASANYDIEQAYQERENATVVFTDFSKEFDFRRMEAKDIRNNTVYKIKRSTVEYDDLPKHWSPMPDDVIYNMVTLDENSEEYCKVKKHFTGTMPQPQLELTSDDFHWHHIVKIERVQNPLLYTKYMSRKKSVDPCSLQSEKKLFHGCPLHMRDKICHHGFCLKLTLNSAIKTAAYGRGILFHQHANHSASDMYSPRDSSSQKYIFVANVLVGEYTRYDDSQLSSASPVRNRCTCGVDDINLPMQFVICDDTQACPEYLITFA